MHTLLAQNNQLKEKNFMHENKRIVSGSYRVTKINEESSASFIKE